MKHIYETIFIVTEVVLVFLMVLQVLYQRNEESQNIAIAFLMVESVRKNVVSEK